MNIGDKIGKWTIIEIGLRKNRKLCHKCICECGYESLVYKFSLSSNRSNSCKNCADRARGFKFIKIGKHIPSVYLSHARGAAKKRNLEFKIDLEYIDDLYEIQQGKCALSGVILTVPKVLKDYGYINKFDTKAMTASLDRIDSRIGYIEGNLQWVHKSVNLMKNSLSDISFISICKLVADYNCTKEIIDINDIYAETNYGKPLRQ